MTDEDYVQIVHRGQLNRTKMAKDAGISKSALDTNSEISKKLSQIEDDLRERGILPPIIEAKTESNDRVPATWDVTARDRQQQNKRVAELEQQVIELKARLKRYQELSEVLSEMGYDV